MIALQKKVCYTPVRVCKKAIYYEYIRKQYIANISERSCHDYEACKDSEHEKAAEYRKEGRLRRVSDILPVCLQDILHRGQSVL